VRFWSKGLGERELVIDLSKGKLTMEEGKVLMRGTIKEPVAWNYEITLFKEDVRGILRVALSIQGIVYFIKNITGVGTYIGKLGSKQAEAKPAEPQPAEAKSAETKPEESAAS